MKPLLAAALLLARADLVSAPEGSSAPAPPPGLALAAELPGGDTAAPEQSRILAELRRTGVSVFALSLSWSDAEPSRGTYRIQELTRAARVLRQSGAVLHFDLPLVVGRVRDVPRDLAGVPFDDPRLSLALGRLLQALAPALADASTLSLAYEADAFFADKPDELRAFLRLLDGAIPFLVRLAPALKVGVTTDAPAESAVPEVAAALHQRGSVLFYLYAPFVRQTPFVHRPPDSLETDWPRLIEQAGARPIAFSEVSYSSAAENGSSPEKQAEFVRRFRRFLARADGRRLLFARYAVWRDPPAAPSASDPRGPDVTRRRELFFANRGLQKANGEAKPAWREWTRAAR